VKFDRVNPLELAEQGPRLSVEAGGLPDMTADHFLDVTSQLHEATVDTLADTVTSIEQAAQVS
jgi:hypothetical protein